MFAPQNSLESGDYSFTFVWLLNIDAVIKPLTGHSISLLGEAAILQLSGFVISNIITLEISSYSTLINFNNFECYYFPWSGFIWQTWSMLL